MTEGGGGVRKCPNLRDVIYEWSLNGNDTRTSLSDPILDAVRNDDCPITLCSKLFLYHEYFKVLKMILIVLFFVWVVV